MNKNAVLLGAALSIIFVSTSQAGLISPTAISGTGVFNNGPSLLSDGVIPVEGSIWTASTNTWWSGQTGTAGVVFTFDYGSTVAIGDLRVSVDNNDAYRVDYSVDNVAYSNLFQIQISDGEIAENPGGMDTMTSIDGDPEFISGINFAPVNARYLRIYATGGDGSYSVGELQAFSVAAVPEPASLLLFGTCLSIVATGVRFRRS